MLGLIGAGFLGKKLLDSMDGSDSRVGDLKTPEYYTDPTYTDSQKLLQTTGSDLLAGKPNEYYAPIGQFGGEDFEKYLALTTRDVEKSAAEAMARGGRGRGGALPAVTAQAVADTSSKSRYANYLQGIEGRKWLFDQGKGITEGVRGAGQAEGANRNNFNLGIFDRQFNQAEYMDNCDLQESQAMGKMLGTFGGAAIGGLIGGPPGAMAGAGIGGSLMGGGGGGGGVGTSQWMDILSSAKSNGAAPMSAAAQTPGVSNFGSINMKVDPNQYLKFLQ